MGIHKEALIGSLVLAFGLSACNGADGAAQVRTAQDSVGGNVAVIPSNPNDGSVAGNPTTGGTPTPSTVAIGVPCASSDPDHICLALKYVVYKDSSGNPVVDDKTAVSNLEQINSIWSQCNIGFQIDNFLEADPTEFGLNFNTPTQAELGTVRAKFVDKTSLLVVTTGTWSSTLGAGSANAWTTMPGGGDYGVVLESSVGDFAPIIAHELGHYLNLDHVNDSSDVMNAIIASTSTQLTTAQCTAARSAVSGYWKAMLR